MEPKGFPAVTMGHGIRWAVEKKVREGWGPGFYVGDWGTLGRFLNLSVAVPTGLEGRMDDFLDRWWAGGWGALWSLHGSLVPGYQYPMGQEGVPLEITAALSKRCQPPTQPGKSTKHKQLPSLATS